MVSQRDVPGILLFLLSILILIIISASEVEEVRAELRNVELDLARVLGIHRIQGLEHLALVFASVQCQDHVEDLRGIILEVLLELPLHLLVLTFPEEALDLRPALLPIFLVHDRRDKFLKVLLRALLLLLLHLDVLCVVLG